MQRVGTIRERVSDHYVAALALYAQQDLEFADWVRGVLPAGGVRTTSFIDVDRGVVTLPETRAMAQRRVHWLIEQNEHAALAALQAYIVDKPQEQPKQIVIGLVGTSIPGLTIGRPKFRALKILVRDDVEFTGISLAKVVQAVTSDLIAKNLQAADGIMRNMDPDMGQWLADERATVFYKASLDTMRRIQFELHEAGVSFCEVRDEVGSLTMAISPAVNGAYADLQWGLESLD